MTSTLRDIAETRFAAITRREETALSGAATELDSIREKTARLKALRLAKEAQTTADRIAKFKQHRRDAAGS